MQRINLRPQAQIKVLNPNETTASSNEAPPPLQQRYAELTRIYMPLEMIRRRLEMSKRGFLIAL